LHGHSIWIIVEKIRKEQIMLKVKRYLQVLSVLVLAGCNAATQSAQVTPMLVSTQTPLAIVNTPIQATATRILTATETMTPLLSETTTLSTAIPFFLTLTPGLLPH
jgi:uncharacterized lipoprotein YajG